MSNKPITLKISIDMDGVLANFPLGFIRQINTVFPGRMSEDYTPVIWQWDVAELGQADADAVWANLDQTENFWETLEPFAENVAALQDFLWDPTTFGVEVYYITARESTIGKTALAQTQTWLSRHSLLSRRSAAITVASGSQKPRIYAGVGIAFSIEDRDSVVRATVAAARPNGKLAGHQAFLLDRTWNASATDLNPVRLPSLRAYLDLVRTSL